MPEKRVKRFRAATANELRADPVAPRVRRQRMDAQRVRDRLRHGPGLNAPRAQIEQRQLIAAALRNDRRGRDGRDLPLQLLCAERGGDGRNVSIVVQYASGRAAAAPGSDLRALISLTAATVRCCDCGHAVAFDEDALDAMPDVETVDDLWRMAFCQPCRSAGSAKPNMTLETNPPWPSADRPSAKPNWSRAQVFGEDRSSPFPNLPPSRLMRG